MMKDLSILDNLITGRIHPHIYAFTTNTVPNYLKVGDTYRPIEKRLNEWLSIFPNLEKKFEGSAKITDDVYFRDFSVHSFLEITKNRIRLTPTDIAQDIYYSREFFKDATPDDIEEAITDIKNNYFTNSHRYSYYDAKTQLPTSERYPSTGIWFPRPNQQATIDAFKRAVNNGRTHLLMYAVMRFGKTFVSMCCAKEIAAKLVVVVSAKADVRDEWRRTIESSENFRNDYEFFSSIDLENNYNIITQTLNHPTNHKKVVVFLTLQDLQGETIKDRHAQIFGRKIDLLIVDETHFGARAEKYGAVLRASRGEQLSKEEKYTVEDALEGTKSFDVNITIHLSGTPYRILMSDEFDRTKDLIAFYQFSDIVHEQEKWDMDNFAKNETEQQEEWENPYFGFPQMIRFAFNPNKSSRKRMEELRLNGISDSFSALFKPMSIVKSANENHKRFIYEQEILELLEVIDGSKEDEELLGFLDYDKIKKGNMCRHIVVVLPYCASCDAFEALIKNNPQKFRNLNSYEIVNISGVDKPNNFREPSDIKTAIKEYESNGKKTITLTVNRMLTGSTVPEWDTMLFLKDTSSPQEYDQAIFRLQNQYIKEFTSDDGKTIKFNMKPQTLLVDFDPKRVFIMQEHKAQVYNANIDESGNSKLRERIDEELRISPVITMNKDKILQVTATNIMEVVSEYSRTRGVAEEVIEIPVDLSLLNISTIRAAIDRENELGSKSGFTIKSSEGDGDDIDTPPIPTEPNLRTEPSTTSEEITTEENSKDTVKQFRSYYARILFFAFLTKNIVISLEDIITCLVEPDNARISTNLGLNTQVLQEILTHADKFLLSRLDYKIQNLNQLSHDENIDAITRASVSVQKFGKLGNAEVITPKHICRDMINMIDSEDLKTAIISGNKILDIASKAGEFALAICEKCFELGLDTHVFRDSIYTIPTSNITYEFTRMIYETLGLNTNNIATKFNSYSLLNIKNEHNNIDYIKIARLLEQDKPFDCITVNDINSRGENTVKFDIVVGNPPYQKEGKNNGRKSPIYNIFMDIAHSISKQTILITPARFLFDAGQTPREWNRRMLSNEHFKVMRYEPNASSIFPDTEIKGGVAITIHNTTKTFEKIGTFTAHHQLTEILKKVSLVEDGNSKLDSIISSQGIYRFSEQLFAEHPEAETVSGSGTGAKIISRIIDLLPNVFVNTPNNLNQYVKLLAKTNSGREYKYIKRDYLQNNPFLDTFNVMIPESNGSGAFETLVAPVIAAPNEGSTDTFISMGMYDTILEAEHLVKYIKTKFARVLLGVKKVTQHNPKSTWEYVPLQDFTNASDISWEKSIPEIDAYLYKKYSLSEEEISFIETNVESME